MAASSVMEVGQGSGNGEGLENIAFLYPCAA